MRLTLNTILRAIILKSIFCAFGFYVETVKVLIYSKVRAKQAKKKKCVGSAATNSLQNIGVTFKK